MIYLPLAAGVPFVMKLVSYVWCLIALLLILIILIQKGKGGGLSGAFGGMGAGGLLGTKTGDFLTWVTIGLVAGFLGLAVLMVKFYVPATPLQEETSVVDTSGAPAVPDDSAAPADTAPAEGASDTPKPATGAPAGNDTGGSAGPSSQ
jgi:preprotein translocase subunit SecG